MGSEIAGGEAAGVLEASVKWFDPAKGFGFLVPVDGSEDVFCHVSAIAGVGLVTLVEGAAVTCEVVRDGRGRRVARILALDFTTAVEAPDEAGEETEPAAQGAGDGTISALVKWFVPDKGYGFLEPSDGSPDLFCHMTAVREAGLEALLQGAVVECEVEDGPRSRVVTRILSVDGAPGWSEGGARPGGGDDGYEEGPAGAAERITGEVKFFDVGKGYGFVVPDRGGSDVFVDCSVVYRSGLQGLEEGQRVGVWVTEAREGVRATDIEPI